jgi:hypothetical protein
MPCAIWNTAATEEPREGNFTIFDSSRAGGRYKITESVSAMSARSVSEKKVITTWLCDQRRLGVSTPTISSYNIEEIAARPLLGFSKRVDRALLFIASKIPRIDYRFQAGNNDATNMLIAEAECEDIRELVGLLQIMQDMNLLIRDETLTNQWQLSPPGWARFEELTTRATDSTQAFVAMWFTDEMSSAWADGIKPAIEDAGYRPLRIDKKEHSDKIDDQIIAEIRRSRFLVADFSCEPGKARGGVYYEAGFAMGLNIPVVWSCRKSSFDDLHFDTRQYNHIPWDTTAELKEQLTNRIRAVIGQGPLKV